MFSMQAYSRFAGLGKKNVRIRPRSPGLRVQRRCFIDARHDSRLVSGVNRSDNSKTRWLRNQRRRRLRRRSGQNHAEQSRPARRTAKIPPVRLLASAGQPADSKRRWSCCGICRRRPERRSPLSNTSASARVAGSAFVGRKTTAIRVSVPEPARGRATGTPDPVLAHGPAVGPLGSWY